MNPTKRTLFLLKDAECGGTLKRRLRSWSKQGKSARDIAHLLSEFGTPVGKSLVYDWQKDMGVHRGKTK